MSPLPFSALFWWQINVVWLDVVTYLHHHGYNEKVPWYRGEVRLAPKESETPQKRRLTRSAQVPGNKKQVTYCKEPLMKEISQMPYYEERSTENRIQVA